MSKERLKQTDIDAARVFLRDRHIDRFIGGEDAVRLKQALDQVYQLSGRAAVDLQTYLQEN